MFGETLEPNSSTQKLATIFAIIVVLGAVAWFGWDLIERRLTASIGYEVNAEFETLPPDDKDLEQWLQKQPGVVKVAIQRNGKAVNVLWIMVQNMWGKPPVPDIRMAFNDCGYQRMTVFGFR